MLSTFENRMNNAEHHRQNIHVLYALRKGRHNETNDLGFRRSFQQNPSNSVLSLLGDTTTQQVLLD